MNKDVQQLLKEAAKQGFTSEPIKRGKRIINPRTMEDVIVYTDAKGANQVGNVRSDLRSIGFQDPRRPPRPKQKSDSPNSRSPAEQAAADTPEEQPMANRPTDTPTRIKALEEVEQDPLLAAQTVAGLVRALSQTEGSPDVMRVNGEDRPGRKWVGDIKEKVFYDLWPELRELPRHAELKVAEKLVPVMLKQGLLRVTHHNGKSTWFVPDEAVLDPTPEPSAPAQPDPHARAGEQVPKQTAPPVNFRSPKPQAPAKPPAPPATPAFSGSLKPASAAPAAQTADRFPCSECCYVGHSAAALNSHSNRTEGPHRDYQEDGAPFRCSEVLSKLTGGKGPEDRIICVVETPSRESLINHMRRRHTELVAGVQFCKSCLLPLPKGNRSAMLEHNLREHGNLGGRANQAHQERQQAVVEEPMAAEPMAADAESSEPEEILEPVVPAPRPAAPALVGDANPDPEAAAQSILTLIDQYRRMEQTIGELRETTQKLQAENAELRKQAAEAAELREQLAVNRADAEELQRLRKQVEAFAAVRDAMSVLMQAPGS